MRRAAPITAVAILTLSGAGAAVLAASQGSTPGVERVGSATPNRDEPLRFADSSLFIEINGTDGDAGLQAEIDADAWRKVVVLDPNGRPLLDFRGQGRMARWGLTGLTFESSEPGFDEVPFARFKARFPEGRYLFRGRGVDGERIVGAARLTHTVPARPSVVVPAPDATVAAEGFTVRWEPVTRPAGVEIADYEVIVAGERGEEFRVLFGPEATSATIPPGVLTPGSDYALEVLARERTGNRTITEVPFRTG